MERSAGAVVGKSGGVDFGKCSRRRLGKVSEGHSEVIGKKRLWGKWVGSVVGKSA